MMFYLVALVIELPYIAKLGVSGTKPRRIIATQSNGLGGLVTRQRGMLY